MAEPKVYAVVLHHRNPDDTLEAVTSLEESKYANLTILVVDNGSGDDLESRLTLDAGAVVLLKNEENLGFGHGCNVGIRRALASGAAYVLLFNNDALAPPALVGTLVRAAEEDPRIGIVGPTVLFEDRQRVWYGGGRFNQVLGYTRHEGIGSVRPDTDREVEATDFVSGCVMLIRRELLESVGLLDGDYFLYLDDLDMSERARRAGFRVLHCPRAQALHKVSVTAGLRGSNVLTPLRAYYYARNPILFLRKRMDGWRRWTALAAQILLLAPYRLLEILVGREYRSLSAYLRGLSDGFAGIVGKGRLHDAWVGT